jgi:hypothetical protein
LTTCENTDEIEAGELTIQFNHEWNGEIINFNELKYVNFNGETLSINKLRYLISNIVLHKTDGSLLELDGYVLVDLNKNNISIPFSNIPFDTYSGLSFTFGFNKNDNLDGAYKDLNAASWNWPTMLGGGYHFMQFEGTYIDDENEKPFTYHMGTAKKSDGVFEENSFEINLGEFDFNKASTLNLYANIAEWFTNPNTWDLNSYNINLMSNYDAQKMMNTNGKTVFSLGEIN